MKTVIMLLGLCAAGTLVMRADDAAPSPKKKTAKAAPAKKAQPGVLTIPNGATANADGTYSYTDKAGAKWRYAKTPFGIMRSPESGPAEVASDPGAEFVKITDSGNDMVLLVRQTPFGPMKSEKKKSELTDAERKIYEDQKAKP